MSGVKPPAVVPDTAPARTPEWVTFFNQILKYLKDQATAQPAFCVTLSGIQTNFAPSQAVTVQFDTVILDLTSDFNTSTYTLTISVAGYYQFNVIVRIDNIDTDSNAYWYTVYLVTSNRTYSVVIDSEVFAADIDHWSFSLPVLADMDKDDTVIIQVRQEGGAQQSDIRTESWFSGFLVQQM